MEDRVAYQGEPGAYSEEAVRLLFGPEMAVLPCRTLRDVFDAVIAQRAAGAVVPIENSLAGSINETYDLLLASPLTITAEAVVDVDHCLMALPGQVLPDIARVISHPQALAQCHEFLHELGVEAMAVHDTAGGARMIREGRLEGYAAIASRRAAELYQLEILKSSIQTHPANQTRFYAVHPHPAPAGGESCKTVLVFTTEHRPGALHRSLGVLAARGINLLKLESRPVPCKPWEYLFYLDIQGHAEDMAVSAALEELAQCTVFLRVLGSFPKWPSASACRGQAMGACLRNNG
ncbi:MAG: prephenate dehydratase [Bacillota bacterium]